MITKIQHIARKALLSAIMAFESNGCMLATTSTLLSLFVSVVPLPLRHFPKHSNALNFYLNEQKRQYVFSNHCPLAARNTLLLSFVTIAPLPMRHFPKHSNVLNFIWMNKKAMLYLILCKFNPINATINHIGWRDRHGTCSVSACLFNILL